MAEQGVTDLDPLDQVERDLLAHTVPFDECTAVCYLDDPRLDRDVTAGDAGVIEQAGVLEEDVHEFPEHVVCRLVHLLPDMWVVRWNCEGEVGGAGVERDRQELAELKTSSIE